MAAAGLFCGRGAVEERGRPLPEDEQLRIRAAELIRLEQNLTEEFPLARDPAPYLVVDLPARSVALKAGGRRLRNFKILDLEETSEVGKGDQVWTLVDNRALQKTERTKIEPGTGQDVVMEKASQDPWGPQRMPIDFDLVCADGRMLEIRSLPEEESGLPVLRGIKVLYRLTADWVRRWGTDDSEARSRIRLWLGEKDSQLLFWSLPGKLQILVRPTTS